jgi:hypothetical protein
MGLAWSASKEIFGATSHYESYAYRVLQDYGKWSVRQYAPAVAAETVGGQDNNSFRHLARYIGVFSAPENDARSPVAMTTPVVSRPQAIAMTTPVVSSYSDDSCMRFVLPSEYTRVEDAPAPTNPKVRLVAIPACKMAAISFSGYCDGREDASGKYDDLISFMKGSGWAPAGQWELHRHNPPYTLGPFRTNEVVVPVVAEAGGNETPAGVGGA